MKKFIKCLLILAVIVGVSGCGASEKDFVNTSYTSDPDVIIKEGHSGHRQKTTISFHEDGQGMFITSCIVDNEIIVDFAFSWKLDGQNIKIEDPYGGESVYKIEGNRLIYQTPIGQDGTIYYKDK